MPNQTSFQIYYSKQFKLYDLTIFKNKIFFEHYHVSSLKEINKIIQQYK